MGGHGYGELFTGMEDGVVMAGWGSVWSKWRWNGSSVQLPEVQGM